MGQVTVAINCNVHPHRSPKEEVGPEVIELFIAEEIMMRGFVNPRGHSLLRRHYDHERHNHKPWIEEKCEAPGGGNLDPHPDCSDEDVRKAIGLQALDEIFVGQSVPKPRELRVVPPLSHLPLRRYCMLLSQFEFEV